MKEWDGEGGQEPQALQAHYQDKSGLHFQMAYMCLVEVDSAPSYKPIKSTLMS